ncbi:MAG: DUF3791 domain-containing protein [Lachnospiraceae bacterium]|jgi:hypothetical protein|nr:DUF3791 domain-containing protein [Lachnospiraceae bacterium]
MSKQADFFIYLIERYAAAKKTTAPKILAQWDSLNLTDFIYDMYELYHIEHLENAIIDIDSLIKERQNG